MTEGYEETTQYGAETIGNEINKPALFEIQEQLPEYSDVIASAPPLSQINDIPPQQLSLQIDSSGMDNTAKASHSFVEDIGCWKGYSESHHSKSLLLTIISLTLIAVLIAFQINAPDPYHHYGMASYHKRESHETYMFGTMMALYICYLLYIIECCCSSSRKYLKNLHDQETVALIVTKTRETPPAIAWNVQCYHYETRSYIDTYTDSNGETRSQLKTETVRVNTHSAYKDFNFAAWTDVSEPWHSIHDHKLTKITCDKAYCFANAETQRFYCSELASFKSMNDRDSYQDFSENFTIDGMKTKLLAEMQPGVTPYCLSSGWFWCWSVLFMSCCYRVWFASMVGRKKYVFVKQISI